MVHRKLIYLILSLVLIFSISFVSSTRTEQHYIYNGTIDSSGNYNHGTTLLTGITIVGYVCSSPTCSSISTSFFGPVNTGATNPYNLIYPTSLQSSYGYLLYFFKTGYIPYAAGSNLYGNGPAPDQNDYLYQKQFCKSNITGLQVTGNRTLGNTLNIQARIYSPINNHGPTVYRPPQYLDHFKSNVIATLQITNKETLQSEYITNTGLISFSDYRDVDFTYVPSIVGNYSFNLSTACNDQKCLNSVSQSVITNVEILSLPITPPVITLPTIAFISPENRTYTNSTILISLSSVNATNVWWSDGTTNYPYTTPVTHTFSNGSHTITAYANNSAGTVSTQITFSVNTSMPPITPPHSSSNKKHCKNNSIEELIILEEDKPARIGNNTIYFSTEEDTNKKDNFSLVYLVSLFGLNLVLLIVLLALLIRR